MKKFQSFRMVVMGLIIMGCGYGSAAMASEASTGVEPTPFAVVAEPLTMFQATLICDAPTMASVPTRPQLFLAPEFLQPPKRLMCALDENCVIQCEQLCDALYPPGVGPTYWACARDCIFPGCCL